MTTWGLFTHLWSWDPTVLLGSAALLAIYLAAVRSWRSSKTVFFIGGVLVTVLALESPIDHLGDTYLFSAHMLQHLLLILIAAPLLLMGLPAELAERILSWPFARRVEKFINRPVLTWLVGMLTLWTWHLPVLYNAALANENLHAFEHLTFLVSAVIFFWPVLSPLEEHRIHPLAGVLYLFFGGASNSILGILLTYAPLGLYPRYLHPNDEYGVLNLIRQGWGLTPQLDQQIGGLLMWVPGGLIYLAGAMAELARWYAQPETDDLPVEQDA